MTHSLTNEPGSKGRSEHVTGRAAGIVRLRCRQLPPVTAHANSLRLTERQIRPLPIETSDRRGLTHGRPIHRGATPA